MSELSAASLREKFLSFFSGRDHAVLPSASLVPERDPTALFTTAGMQPLVPYLLGQPHPRGRRLASVQKCLRTDDIEEVGDATHLTFFEMLGNWSLGDYGREEAIAWSAEFLTSDRWLGVPVGKIAVTIFAGDADAPRDEDAARVWRAAGIPRDRIVAFGKEENWWGPVGTTGPAGPDTEVFYDMGAPSCGKPDCGPNCPCGTWVEIWNIVFMEYEKKATGVSVPLRQKNVDTGMGLERAVAALNGRRTVFETDIFSPLMAFLRAAVPRADLLTLRRLADHLRAAVFVLADPRGVTPSNVERGYVLRRLIRRSLRWLQQAGVSPEAARRMLERVPSVVADIFEGVYPEVRERARHAGECLIAEERRFGEVVRRAQALLERRKREGKAAISGAEGFRIYQETGAHPDLLASLGAPMGIAVDREGFEEELARHREVSRAGMDRRFAGGLADHSAQATKYHTATHLLHAALRRVLGDHVRQKGSNVTAERLRFDFSHRKKLTSEELRKVEDLVNAAIEKDLPVTRELMTPAEAKARGALGFFEDTYGDRVSVYAIGDFSKEICGGPHVERTGMVGAFRITKEEAVSAGVRRIRAVVE